MTMQARTITLRSDAHYGRRPPAREFGQILHVVPGLVRRAIRMAIEGRSTDRGARPGWLNAASDVRFVGHDGEDETILRFEAPTLGEAAPDIFQRPHRWPSRPDPQDTGFDLLGDVVRDVGAEERDSGRFDRGLLTELRRLGRGLDEAFSECVIEKGGRMAGAAAVIDRAVIASAERLSSLMPRPRQVRVVGTLDMLRASTNALAIQLESGEEAPGVLVRGDVAAHRDLLKRQVVVMGKAVYRPSGNLLRIDVVEMRPARPEDAFFKTIPEPSSNGVSIERAMRRQGRRRGVAGIIGRWPGDETDEQIEQALRELS